MISAVIITLNEEEKLKKCLESIKNFADEIVVIDLNSDDQTARIAQEFGKVYHHPKVAYVEKLRNWAISKLKGDWILVLDPDELIQPALREYLKKNLDQGFVAFNIPRKNIFFNCWIKHTNFWPDRQIRFFKKGKVYWPEKIHTYPHVSGNIKDVEMKEELAILHFGYDNYSEFFKRQERYSQIEVIQRRLLGDKSSIWQLLWRPLRIFLVRFMKYQGYLDGLNGLFLVAVLMIYQFKIEWKLLSQK